MQASIFYFSFSVRKIQNAIIASLLATILLSFFAYNQAQAQQFGRRPFFPKNDNNSSTNWSVAQNNIWYQPNAGNEFYVLLSIKGGNALQDKARAPLNISVVMDRSGSMEGDKMRNAQKAINFLIEQLGPQDKLSVVHYDDVVQILSKQQSVQNKELLKSKVNALRPGGSTNLSGGTLAGYQQVASMKRSGYVNRVLLLSDGLANAGITSPARIKEMVNQQFSTAGIGLSTFGVGADYNEDLMTMMAESGRGNYYFIGQADQIPNLFAQELNGLLNVVAQNAYAQISLPRNIICEQVFGYPYTANGNTININFNDVFANEEKIILVKLRATTTQYEPFSIAGSLHFTDANDFQNHSSNFNTRFSPTSDKEKINSHTDKKVAEMIALYKSAEQFDKIIEDADKRDYSAARSKASEALKDIKEKQKTMPSAKLRAQEAKLEEYVSVMEDIESRSESEVKMIQKAGKAANYSTKKNK